MSTSTPPKDVPTLDGVRALAIGAVLLVHAGVPGFAAGRLGVDLFFALSGFLITTLLMVEYERRGRISYGNFLVRRGLRLLPAYILYLVVLTYAMWGWPGSVLSEHGGWTPVEYTIALWGYFMNFAPQGGIWNGQIISVHLWSLAVEQQYYLVWPLVVILLVPYPKRLLAVGIVLTVATVIAFLATPEGLYKLAMLPTRGFTLVLASTVAIAAHLYRDAVRQCSWQWVYPVGGVLVAAVFAVNATRVMTDAQVEQLLPLISLVFVGWIVALWYQPRPGWVSSFLLHPWLRYIGRVSYGIYLYHELIRVATWYFTKPEMADWPPALGFATRLALYILLSVAVAAASYEWFELRFLSLRGKFRSR